MPVFRSARIAPALGILFAWPAPAPAVAGSPEVELLEWEVRVSEPVPAGAVVLQVRNVGRYSHALEVEGPGIETETATLGTGEEATLEVNLQPGKYEFYCPIPGHRERGMLTVVEVAP